jgi:hypothetical protein
MQPDTLESALNLLRNSSPTPLDRVVAIVRSHLNCQAAALIASDGVEATVISAAGFPMMLAARAFPMRPEYVAAMSGPFEIDLAGALECSAFKDHPWLTSALPWTFVASLPVPLRVEGWNIQLMCFDQKDRRGENLPMAMTAAAGIIADELSLISEIAAIPPRTQSLSTTLHQIGAAMQEFPCSAILLDQDLTVIEVNEGISTNLFFGREEQIGRPLAAIMQKFGMHEDAMSFIKSQFTAEPGAPIFRGRIFAGAEFNLSALRFDCDNPHKKYLLVLLDTRNGEQHLLKDCASEFTPELDVAGGFLLETLIGKRRLITRQDVSYHALFRWRAPLKDYQLSALKQIKQHRPPAFIDRVAEQFAAASLALFGKSALRTVANVACGHGGPNCFAHGLAAAVADKVGLPFVEVFAPLNVAGSSHPRKNARRPAMQLIQVPEGPVLLIDDVASSGSHIAEATKALRDAGCSTFPMAWIGP